MKELRTKDVMLCVNNYSDFSNVSMSTVHCLLAARQVINDEMRYLSMTNPSINIDKIQAMLSSEDEEMRELAYNTLKQVTKYSGRIIHYLEKLEWNNVDAVVKEYVENNKINIANKIL